MLTFLLPRRRHLWLIRAGKTSARSAFDLAQLHGIHPRLRPDPMEFPSLSMLSSVGIAHHDELRHDAVYKSSIYDLRCSATMSAVLLVDL